MYNAVDVWLQLICNKFQRRHYHYLLSFIIDKTEKFPFKALCWQGEKNTAGLLLISAQCHNFFYNGKKGEGEG